MRVISGRFGGRVLKGPRKGERTIRPSSDRLREALFNILVHQGLDFTASAGLDLYAGTGALGFEAVSRGAKRVLWVDDSREACALIEENRLAFSLQGGADFTIWKMTVLEALGSAKMANWTGLGWIFLDPPYGLEETPQVLCKIGEAVREMGWLKKTGVVVLETSHRDARDYGVALGAGFSLLTDRRYGEARLRLWRYEP